MNNKQIITCKDVGFGFEWVLNFKKFNISFLPGAFVAIYGTNGIGTTSLLKMIAKKIQPNLGHISNNLHSIFISDNQLDLKENQTVKNNLSRWGNGDQDIVSIATECFFLADLLDKKCTVLSPGEKKRVGLSKLLITRPFVWLLDRPLEQLDDAGADALFTAISARINSDGIVICATGLERHLDYYSSAIKINLDDFWD